MPLKKIIITLNNSTRLRKSQLDAYGLFLYIEMSQYPLKSILEQERIELKEKWKKDHHFHVIIYIWKNDCVILSYTGVQIRYHYDYLWFENIEQFMNDLHNFMGNYYSKYLAKNIKSQKSIFLTKDKIDGWEERAKAYKEIREPKVKNGKKI